MLVDDHEAVRKGLRDVLETNLLFRVVAEAAGMEEALHKAQDNALDNALDLVVTDLEMPQRFTNGIELTQRLRAAFPELLVVIYTVHDEDKYIFQAIKAGAHGYVKKNTPARHLIDTLNKVVNGRIIFPPVSNPELLLTPAEQRVFWLLGDSKSNEYIAEKLSIADRTVDGHRSKSLQKLRPILQVKGSENESTKYIQLATKYAERCPFPSK